MTPEKQKRKPTEYNKFIKKCTSDGKNMKTCAKEWKDHKNDKAK